MEHAKPLSHLLRYEVIGFGSLIAMYWLVELPMVPTLILGADAHAAWDRIESALLTTLALLVACPIAFRTRRLASRVSYLEELLRKDPWSRREEGLAGRRVLVARLGDGSLTTAWRFALDDWVQSIAHPEIVGRVMAGRAWRSAAGSLREEYEIELDGNFRLILEGGHLRFMPLCDGRPMRFVGTRRGAQEFTTLV
jgi:hypothetical protein